MRALMCSALLATSSSYALSQSPQATLLDLLKAQLAASGLHQSLTINGTATWVAGSTHDAGAATLEVKADGSTQVTLGLSTYPRADVSGPLASRSCSWIDSAGASHAVTGANCLTPVAWFSPVVLPLLLSSPGVIVSDGGTVTESGLVRHQLIVDAGSSVPGLPPAIASAMQLTITYDPTTLLPSSLEYSLHPNGDDSRSIPAKVLFSDYRPVSGIPVPFHIERYINRTLELTIAADSVVLN